MSAASWLQFVVLIAVRRRHRGAARPLHGKGVRRRREVARRSLLRPDRAADLPDLPHRPDPGAALDRLRLLAARVQHRLVPRRVRAAAVPGVAAVEPDRHAGRRPAPVVQHRGQLHDQHELAVLRRRGDDEPPHPDGGPRGAELRVGRGRHGDRGRPHPGHLPAAGIDHRQLLGRPHPLDHAHPAAAVVRVRDRAGEPGRDPELRRLHRRPRPSRPEPSS